MQQRPDNVLGNTLQRALYANEYDNIVYDFEDRLEMYPDVAVLSYAYRVEVCAIIWNILAVRPEVYKPDTSRCIPCLTSRPSKHHYAIINMLFNSALELVAVTAALAIPANAAPQPITSASDLSLTAKLRLADT